MTALPAAAPLAPAAPCGGAGRTGASSALALGVAGAVLLACLAGCGSAPRGPVRPDGPPTGPPTGGWPARDGPGDNPPPNLMQVPDAEPRVEPLRAGGPNKPYAVLGQGYTPHSSDVALRERGLASWYGRKFHGKPTSNGEVYDMYAMTAAHRTMPLPSYARVRNPANGRSVVVRVNDRGPFVGNRVADLSRAAAEQLNMISAGLTQARLEVLGPPASVKASAKGLAQALPPAVAAARR